MGAFEMQTLKAFDKAFLVFLSVYRLLKRSLSLKD
jgi:hypothetical protein